MSCNHPPKVSIIGAGNVGKTLAQRVIEHNLADVCLLDIVEGLPQGIALDLTQAQGLENHHRHIIGSNNYQDTAESDIVVITAGIPRKPGMSREDLIQINGKIVTESAGKSLQYSPNAIFIVVTNPLDVMAYLVWKTLNISPEKVIGMAGVLDSARLQSFIAMELTVAATDIQTMVLGSHGDLMLPIPRYCTVKGIPITELMDSPTIDKIVQRTKEGGAEIVKLMQHGSAYYAPASSCCYMIESILLNLSRVLLASVYLRGEYGFNDVYLGVPCILGCNGVEKIISLNLTPEEKKALQLCADSVSRNIRQTLPNS